MRTTIILILCVMNLRTVSGQNKYDFNKNYTIGYSANIGSLSLYRVGAGIKQHNFVLQRVITRRVSLILGYTSTKFTSKLNFGDVDESLKFMYYQKDQFGRTFSYNLKPQGETVVRANSFNIGVRTYMKNRGAIAPYGRFFEFKFGYTALFNKPEEDHVSYTDPYQSDTSVFKNELPNAGIAHLNVLSFQSGYGSSIPIVKNLSFDWLISFTMNIPMWGAIPPPSIYYKQHDEVYYKDMYFYRCAYLDFRMKTRVRLNVGLHYAF